MMGQHARSESLFYYFPLEDQVPENHLLRLIDTHIDFGFVREQLKTSYSDTGRPSIDPELLLRIVLIGYCTASAASARWLRNCGCIWRGAGSQVWVSTRRFRITPHFRKTATDAFKNQSCLSSCSSESWPSV